MACLPQYHLEGDDRANMPVQVVGVASGRKKREVQIPAELAAGAASLLRLERLNLLARVDEALRLPRRAGSTDGLAVFALAVLYLQAGVRPSMRAFRQQHGDAFDSVAALVGRRTLPTQASFSRALSSAVPDVAATFADALLDLTPGKADLLRSPCVAHRDGHGTTWHVFDFDPSTRAYRSRNLPAGADLPEPTRRAVGVRGYVGRKRGEIRQQDHVLQHAGTGLWAYYRLNSTGGSAAPYACEAAAAAARWMDEIGHPRKQTILRMDGEFGHAAALRMQEQTEIHFLTRLARYHLFDREPVLQTLKTAVWRSVPGTNRVEATDLGIVQLYETDGAPETPVECRIVVQRRRTEATEPTHGILRDGFQFEMFGTSLPGTSWPAEDVCELYHGRNMIENSFLQSDHVYGLDRTFSYTPSGQAIVVAIAMFLWNDAVTTGALHSKIPNPAPQIVRRESPICPDPGPWPPEAAPAVVEVVQPELPKAEVAPEPQPIADPEVPEAMRRLLVETARARELPLNWTLDAELGVVRCPTGKPLHAFHAEVTQHEGAAIKGQNRISLRTAVGVCDGCPLRSGCFNSSRPNTYKQITWYVARELAAEFKRLLKQARVKPAKRRVTHRTGPRPRHAISPPPGPIFRTPPARVSAPMWPQAPMFSPAAARARFYAALKRVSINVCRGMELRPRKSPISVVRSPDQRRGTRKTWTQRRLQASLPGRALVIATAPAVVRRMLALSPG